MPEKDNKIEHVEGGKSINDLIDSCNNLEEKFNKDFKKPLDKQKKDCLKVCGLDKTPGADIKVAYLGSTLAMAGPAKLTKEDLKEQFSFKGEEPYIEVKVVDEWEPTFTSLQEWIQLYIDKIKEVPDFMQEAEEMMGKAVDVVKNASSDYADLDLMGKAKMVKATSGGCNKVKDHLKTMMADARKM